MADKAGASSSSSKAAAENPNVARRPSKYPSKGHKKPFVDRKMKDVITSNLKMVLGKLGNITEIITSRNTEIGGANVQQPNRIVDALREANVAFKKLEDKKFPEHPPKK